MTPQTWTIVLIGIILFAVSPASVLVLHAFGVDLDERSTLGSVPWLLFYTVPAGVMLAAVWLTVGIVLWGRS